MAMNHLKVIHSTLEKIEEDANDFFKWCEQTGYNTVNSKYHVKDDLVVAIIQYRAKSNEQYEQRGISA